NHPIQTGSPKKLEPLRKDLLKLLLKTYPDRVCRRRNDKDLRALMVGGLGIRLSPSSQVREAKLFLAFDLQEQQVDGIKETLSRQASYINKNWLDEVFPEDISIIQKAVFQRESGRVLAVRTKLFRDLIIEEGQGEPLKDSEAGPLLAEMISN